MQTRLDFNEGSSCILVPHPSTRRRDRLRSTFQVVRSTVQLLQSTGFIQQGNCLVDYFHRQLQSDFILLPLFLQFLTPLWYPDQIENAVGFLASQVAMSYYGSRSSQPTETKLTTGSSRFYSMPSLQRRMVCRLRCLCLIALFMFIFI